MHATRRLLSTRGGAGGGGVLPNGQAAKLLLPTATVWDNMWSAFQGLWNVATNPVHRQAFEDAIASQLIKDTVLQNAYNGSTLTFSLFWNLQDPLWKRQPAFDMKEFAHSVGPALTNFHDFLHCFQNQIRHEFEDFQKEQEKVSSEEQQQAAVDDKNAEEEALVTAGLPIDRHTLEQLLPAAPAHMVTFLKQRHPWRQQVAEDPDGLTGRLARMTTEEYLDGYALSSKLGLAVTGRAVYEEGSATVGQVAILSARAMEIPLPGQQQQGDPEDHRYEEFKASEQADVKMGVAAQIDVLYEVTNRFHEQVPVVPDEPRGLEKLEWKTEHVEYTSLGVAVFEGWLDKGGEEEKTDDDDNESSESEDVLRWKVPLIREPTEFPMTVPSMRTVLPPSEDEDKTTELKPENNTDKEANESENKSKGEESSSSSSSS